jgi:tetratricopeptide (TPR) repeat protein
MKPRVKRLPHSSLCALLMMVALLVGGCSSGPTSTGDAPTISAKAAPLAEKDRAAYNNSLTDLEKGNTQQAAALLTKIANSNPGYLDAWINLAIANYKLKDIDAAKRAIVQAHKLQPTSAEINNIRGLISAEEGRYKDAEQLYIAALKLNPKSASTHYNLALLYDVYYQDIAQAISHYESYLSLSSQKDEETEAWTDELKQILLRRNTQ